MSEASKAMGHCGRELDTKSWKGGTRVFCGYKEEGVVTYPNRGIETHVRRFCGRCKEAK